MVVVEEVEGDRVELMLIAMRAGLVAMMVFLMATKGKQNLQ